MNLTDRQVNWLKVAGWRYVRWMDGVWVSRDPKQSWTKVEDLPEGKNMKETKLNYGDILDLEEL